MLDIVINLPPTFNSTCGVSFSSIPLLKITARQTFGGNAPTGLFQGRRCYTTLGLFGVYSGDKRDDLRTLDGQTITIADQQADNPQTFASQMQQVYQNFGLRCTSPYALCFCVNVKFTGRVTGTNDRIGSLLFPEQFHSLYNPLLFARENYYPQFLAAQVRHFSRSIRVVSFRKGSSQRESYLHHRGSAHRLRQRHGLPVRLYPHWPQGDRTTHTRVANTLP